MPVVRNSARAFISALVVLIGFHAVMSMLGLGTFLARNIEPPSPDRAFEIFAFRLGIDAALLLAGHWLLRSFGLATRLAYGLMGGAAAAAGYAIALSQNLNLLPPLDGTRLTASVLPMMVGMIAATMYAQFAGREMLPARNGNAGNPDPAPAPAAPVHFDGPVQVRTSVAAPPLLRWCQRRWSRWSRFPS
jgi:Zn-dependent protease